MGEDWMEDVAKAGGFEKHAKKQMREEIELKKLELEHLKVLKEIPKEQWQDIKESTHNLKAIIEGGGADQIIEDFKQHITDTIQENIAAQLAPIYNEIDTLLNTAISQFFTDNNLDDFMNDVAEWMGGNNIGTFAGALLGSIWGKLGSLIGAIVGAAVQEAITYWWDTLQSALAGEGLPPSLDPLGGSNIFGGNLFGGSTSTLTQDEIYEERFRSGRKRRGRVF